MKNRSFQFSTLLSICVLALFSSCSEKKKSLDTSSNYHYGNLDGVYAAVAKQEQGATGANTYPAVMVETEDGATIPMHMTALKVDVQVIGNIATTTMEMQFFNSMNQTIEGHMYFPLMEGQTISRFAMDVNGKMRDGVTVEKERGRKGFESVTRRQIDPGLIEWTKGNNFKARVYPIPARGTKQIIIAYDQELTPVDKGYQYTLPFNFKGEIPRFRTQARVYQQDLAPIMDGNELERFRFKQDDKDFVGGVIFKDYEANKPFVFIIPNNENFKKVVVAKDVDDETYFLANVKPTIEPRKREIPESIALVWDISNSSTGRNQLKELKVLKDYFARIGSTKVDLITFSNDIVDNKRFEIVNGNSEKLINYLIDKPKDGGTQLGCVDLAKYKNDVIVLSTDGISNIGQKNIGLGNSPVFVINSNVVSDHSYLKNIAYSTGGEYINSTILSAEESVDMMLEESVKFISLENENGIVENSYPSKKTQISHSLSLSGKLSWNKTDLKINFGYDDEVAETITVSIDDDKVINSKMMKRIWAQKKLAELDLNYEKNKDEITALGLKHGLVTRNTSLIVLDRMQDYMAFGITPPEEVLIENNMQESSFVRSEFDGVSYHHESQVLQAFANKKALYDQNFDLSAEAIVNDESSTENVQGGRGEIGSFSIFNYGSTFQAAANDGGALASHTPNYENMSYSEDSKPNTPSSGNIELVKYNSKRIYMRNLRGVSKNELYNAYLETKKSYGGVPSFYVDAAALLSKVGKSKEALRVLSNLAELELENSELLRVLGTELVELGELDLAISIYRDVLEIRGEEPQSYRDLALLLSDNGEYQEAVDLLSEVVNKEWDNRFAGIEGIAIADINNINQKAGGNLRLNIDESLQDNLECDIRVVLSWNADNTDVDLWVTDGRGERCHSGHMKTSIGGVLSNNYVGGYGPEEFWAKEAAKGTYKIQAKFNGKIPQRIAGPVTVSAKIYTDFGRDTEKVKDISVRIEKRNEVVSLGEIEIVN